MVQSEGDMSLKNPVTPPGIDPGTATPLLCLWGVERDSCTFTFLFLVFPVVSSTQVLSELCGYEYLISPMPIVCATHLAVRDLVTAGTGNLVETELTKISPPFCHFFHLKSK